MVNVATVQKALSNISCPKDFDPKRVTKLVERAAQRKRFWNDDLKVVTGYYFNKETGNKIYKYFDQIASETPEHCRAPWDIHSLSVSVRNNGERDRWVAMQIKTIKHKLIDLFILISEKSPDVDEKEALLYKVVCLEASISSKKGGHINNAKKFAHLFKFYEFYKENAGSKNVFKHKDEVQKRFEKILNAYLGGAKIASLSYEDKIKLGRMIIPYAGTRVKSLEQKQRILVDALTGKNLAIYAEGRLRSCINVPIEDMPYGAIPTEVCEKFYAAAIDVSRKNHPSKTIEIIDEIGKIAKFSDKFKSDTEKLKPGLQERAQTVKNDVVSKLFSKSLQACTDEILTSRDARPIIKRIAKAKNMTPEEIIAEIKVGNTSIVRKFVAKFLWLALANNDNVALDKIISYLTKSIDGVKIPTDAYIMKNYKIAALGRRVSNLEDKAPEHSRIYKKILTEEVQNIIAQAIGTDVKSLDGNVIATSVDFIHNSWTPKLSMYVDYALLKGPQSRKKNEMAELYRKSLYEKFKGCYDDFMTCEEANPALAIINKLIDEWDWFERWYENNRKVSGICTSDEIGKAKKVFAKYGEIIGDFDESAIKKAYRSLAQKVHPDKGGTKEAMQEINEATKVLRDSLKFNVTS